MSRAVCERARQAQAGNSQRDIVRRGDECLNEQWFESLHQARQEIGHWRRDYNEVRPHSAIGRIPPAEFAALHRRHAGDARQSPEVS